VRTAATTIRGRALDLADTTTREERQHAALADPESTQAGTACEATPAW
jgi:hypothetical protein